MVTELDEIIQTWRAFNTVGGSAILATAIPPRSSRWGDEVARMLVLPDGRRIGTLPAGTADGGDGTPRVLFEPADSRRTSEMLAFLGWQRRTGHSAVIVTVVRTGRAADLRVGDHLLVNCDGIAGGALAETPWGDLLLPSAGMALQQQGARFQRLGTAEFLVESLAWKFSSPPAGGVPDAYSFAAVV